MYEHLFQISINISYGNYKYRLDNPINIVQHGRDSTWCLCEVMEHRARRHRQSQHGPSARRSFRSMPTANADGATTDSHRLGLDRVVALWKLSDRPQPPRPSPSACSEVPKKRRR